MVIIDMLMEGILSQVTNLDPSLCFMWLTHFTKFYKNATKMCEAIPSEWI